MSFVDKKLTRLSLYPWLIIGLCASVLFYKYILNVSPSIMAHELMRQFQITGAQLGNLAAAYFYTYTIVQLFAGILLDRFGARLLTGVSILVSAAGAALFAATKNLDVAIIARGMMGFGIAFATVTYLKMTAVWFKPRQMAFIGGLLATAVMLGAVFGQAPLAVLMDHTSWRFVLYFCSILGVVITVLFIFFVRNEPKTPMLESMMQSAQMEPASFSWVEVKKVLKNKQNWLLTLYSGLAFSPLSAFGGLWGNSFLQTTYHFSRTEAATLMSALFIGLGVGSPLFGLLSDRLNNRTGVMKAGAALSLIFMGVVVYWPDLPAWALGGALFLLGCGVGAFMLGFTVGTQGNSLRLAATVVAIINTGDAVFESMTEPLLGKLLDLNWSGQIVDGARYFSSSDYHAAFFILPCYFLFAFFLLFFIKEPTER